MHASQISRCKQVRHMGAPKPINQSINSSIPQLTDQLGDLFCSVVLRKRCTVGQSILVGLAHLSELFN